MELMISMVVIGVLLTVGYSQYTKIVNNAKATQLVDQLKQIEVGLASYYRDTGSYPLDLSLLVTGETSTNVDCYDARHKAIGKGGDTYVKSRHSSKGYVDGMSATDNGCIKGVVGVEICMGAVIDDGSGSLTSFDTTTNVFNGGLKNACGPSEKSVGNGGTYAYHLLTVKNIEIDILESVFQNLVGQDMQTHFTSLADIKNFKNVKNAAYTPTGSWNIDLVKNATNYEYKIGVGASTEYQSQKAFVYRYRAIY